MDAQPKNNTAVANRILLAAAIIFFILPLTLFFLEKAGVSSGIFNPKFIIGLVIVGVFGADRIYLKINQARKQHGENT